MAKFRNIILDWSGTLVDDFNPVLAATNEIFKHYGKPPFSADEFREKFYLPFPAFYAEYLPESALPELDHHYHTAFKLLQLDIQPLPYALDFLNYLAERKFNVFLLSTIHHEHFEVQGGRLGVKHHFKQAYTQALDKRKTILQLLAEHDLDAGETMFIGDMMHDIDTAKHGGVTSCAVLTGYDSLQKLKSCNPDLMFRNLREVRDFLDRHQGELEHPPIPTVGALIFNEAGQVLMIQTHKWSHKWGIPGGKIKWNETNLDALHREIAEETGLKLRDIRFEMIQDCIQPPEFYKRSHFLLLNYTGIATSMEVTLNDEAENHRWLSLEEACQLDLNTPTRILIDHVRLHPRS